MTRYIWSVDINYTNIVKISSTFYDRNTADKLLEDYVIMPTQDYVNILNMRRVETIWTVSHVSECNDKVALVLFFQNFAYIIRIFDMIFILNFFVVHSWKNSRPVLSGNSENSNFHSKLFNDNKVLSFSKIFTRRYISQVSQQPWKVRLVF